MPSPIRRSWMFRLMFLVLVTTGLYGLFRSVPWVLAVFILSALFLCLLIAFSCRQFTRNRPRAAIGGFIGGATLANGSIAALCIYQLDWGGYGLMALVIIFLLPVGIGCGVAWAGRATSQEAPHRRSAWPALVLVVAVCGLPPAMIATLWPLRLAFIASRPELEALADRVAGGERITAPTRAGGYCIVDSAVDPETGNVALVLFGGSPNARFGFVRVEPKGGSRSLGPLKKLELDIVMDPRWSYQSEE